jgi:hypothetical protein
MIYQPLSNHVKGKYDGVIFSSDTEIKPKNNDKIYFEGGILDKKFLLIQRILPQIQHGMFMINKKAPNILELL